MINGMKAFAKVGILVVGLAACGAAAAEPLPVSEVAPGIFVHAGVPERADRGNHGDIANLGFIVGDAAVAVIDTGNSPSIGSRLREAIRARTDLPIRYVVNTHMHPDHVFGNAAFVEDRPVFVAHANFQGALMARADGYQRRLEEDLGAEEAAAARLVPPRLTVEGSLELDLGNRVLALKSWPTAHTNNDLTVFDRRTRTLLVGDLVFMERLPTVDGSALGWLQVMNELAALDADRVVPGHGPASADWPGALEDQRRYLTFLVNDIRAIQKDGGTMDRAAEEAAASERAAWRLFDEDNPRNAVAVFAELEWE
jgi:quinoprotein relay system zinc metallohydrolase 2